jgi:hypothetical protein
MPYVNRAAGINSQQSKTISSQKVNNKRWSVYGAKSVGRFFYNVTNLSAIKSTITYLLGRELLQSNTMEALGVPDCFVLPSWELADSHDELEDRKKEVLGSEFPDVPVELALCGGEIVPYTIIAGAKSKLNAISSELREFLQEYKDNFNAIYKHDLVNKLDYSVVDFENLYQKTNSPRSRVKYTLVEARTRIAHLKTLGTATEIFQALVADRIIVNSKVNTSNLDGDLRSFGNQLTKLYQAERLLNAAPAREEEFNDNVIDNLANRMREKRKILVGTVCGIGKRHAMPGHWRYFALLSKRVTQLYRWCIGMRVKTRNAVRGEKWGWFGYRSNGFLSKYEAQKDFYDTASEVQKTEALRAVNARKANPRAFVARDHQRLYNAMRIHDALNEVHKADPGFRLLGEMFEAYHENLYAVKDDPKLCGKRMAKYFKEMVETLAVKRSIAGARPGADGKAGSSFEITEQDKQQIYKLFYYVLPTEPVKGMWEVKSKILEEFRKIAKSDQDLKNCQFSEVEYDNINYVQKLLFDRLTT